MRFVGIDPSTKTGFVALDEQGNVLRAKELTGVGAVDPKRMVSLIDEIVDHLRPNDVVCIEGFAFGAQGQGVDFQYGLGHGIRMALYRRGRQYIEVNPTSVKKFATGKGNTKKDEMVLPIFKRWGFEHPSDNVRDAYVLAQIALALKGDMALKLTKEQIEVLNAILNPPEKKKRKKVAK
ncbi:hypothetical protein [Brevibacillus borstelensis]